MQADYKRLGLLENGNIYHYITRDKGKFSLFECDYPLIDTNNLTIIDNTKLHYYGQMAKSNINILLILPL